MNEHDQPLLICNERFERIAADLNAIKRDTAQIVAKLNNGLGSEMVRLRANVKFQWWVIGLFVTGVGTLLTIMVNKLLGG